MQPSRHIVLLGGSAAGWMAALALVTSQRMVGIDKAHFLRTIQGSYRPGTALRDRQI